MCFSCGGSAETAKRAEPQSGGLEPREGLGIFGTAPRHGENGVQQVHHGMKIS